ncbi:uncharacterized protein KY384_007877 [Bacidia gigantensis]|uniref:uncharacterized protein n=1 Tax=Bacidia gigantensis TaxID=2732470 RepID=UPI001D05318F|nr:uncharacterized protein KY384_007877 [Bacidia gigantensis]KAG8527723.1 hypothetical protein KY384_007877 [Bacidia gigantensis]
MFVTSAFVKCCLFTILVGQFSLAWPTQSGLFDFPRRTFSPHAIQLSRVQYEQAELVDRSATNGTQDAPVVAGSEQTQNPNSTPANTGNGTSSGFDPAPGFIPNDPTVSAATNCTDLTSHRDNKCWEELQLTSWTNKWIATNSAKCLGGETFASCFLRLQGFGGLDCDGIKIDACVPPQANMSLIQPEVYYVAYNIYAINQFFVSWWTAVGNAGTLAGLNVDEIVQLVHVPDNTNLIMDDILIALTGIFTVAPVATAALRTSLESISVATRYLTSMQVIEGALFGYPQIGRYLFPAEGADATFIQIADLKTQLVGILQKVQDNLNLTLVDTMTDVNQFLAFASQGNFTYSAPSLPDQANYLLYGFNTYIVSAALAGNDIHAVLAIDTDPHQLATNGTKLNYDIDCKNGYNEVGVCDQWWYDNETNIAYGLDDYRHMNRDWYDTLTALLSNYTTGELLFTSAFACNTQGGYGAPVNVTVNSAGVNTACLSQLQTLRWDKTCTQQKVGTTCEFLDGPSQNGWMSACGSHSFFSGYVIGSTADAWGGSRPQQHVLSENIMSI